jgi:hypothetical protein
MRVRVLLIFSENGLGSVLLLHNLILLYVFNFAAALVISDTDVVQL